MTSPHGERLQDVDLPEAERLRSLYALAAQARQELQDGARPSPTVVFLAEALQGAFDLEQHRLRWTGSLFARVAYVLIQMPVEARPVFPASSFLTLLQAVDCCGSVKLLTSYLSFMLLSNGADLRAVVGGHEERLAGLARRFGREPWSQQLRELAEHS